MKKLISAASALCVMVFSFHVGTSSAQAADPSLSTPDMKFGYVTGMNLAQRLKQAGIEVDPETFGKGLLRRAAAHEGVAIDLRGMTICADRTSCELEQARCHCQ